MDFTINKYKKLLESLKAAGYTFQTFADFLSEPATRAVILRHDVDAMKYNSLRFARIQASMEIRGSYYFRMVPGSFDREVIREIAARGHEVGYHYETMDTANGDVELAYELFDKNLGKLRRLVPVKTVCMHGSPLSKYDNRSLWEHYDYRELGIIGEPYFDIDFGRVLYLTDTGRRWDGEKVSLRDKAYVKHEKRKSKNENRNSTQNPKLKHIKIAVPAEKISELYKQGFPFRPLNQFTQQQVEACSFLCFIATKERSAIHHEAARQ